MGAALHNISATYGNGASKAASGEPRAEVGECAKGNERATPASAEGSPRSQHHTRRCHGIDATHLSESAVPVGTHDGRGCHATAAEVLPSRARSHSDQNSHENSNNEGHYHSHHNHQGLAAIKRRCDSLPHPHAHSNHESKKYPAHGGAKPKYTRRPPFAPYIPKTSTSSIMMPALTCKTNWDLAYDPTTLDLVYRHCLRMLRYQWIASSGEPTKVRLSVFDFDNTLFKSPMPNCALWDARLIGKLKSTDLGWFHDPRTLHPPHVTDASHHWIESIVDCARAEIGRPDTMTILLTGRTFDTYNKRIRSLLRAKSLRFDLVVLKEVSHVTPEAAIEATRVGSKAEARDDTPPSELKYIDPLAIDLPNTFLYKMQVLEDILACIPSIKDVFMWDDRTYQCEKMQAYLDQLRVRRSDRFKLTTVYYVPPQTIYMNEALERQLVHSMVDKFNRCLMQKASMATGESGDNNGAGALSVTSLLMISPSPSPETEDHRHHQHHRSHGHFDTQKGDELPLGAIQLIDKPSPNPSLTMSKRCQQLLRSHATMPKDWHWCFMLMSTAPRDIPTPKAMSQAGIRPGVRVRMVVYQKAIITNLFSILRVRVLSPEQPQATLVPQGDDDDSGEEQRAEANVADLGIVCAFNPAVDWIPERSPTIQYWSRLHKPFEVTVVVNNNRVTGMRVVGEPDKEEEEEGSGEVPSSRKQQAHAAVSIGRLVMERYPHLKGPSIGQAVSIVKNIMADNNIENCEKSRHLIKEIVAKTSIVDSCSRM